MQTRFFTWVIALCGALVSVLPARVLAGPIELFNAVKVASGNPDRMVVRWVNGDGGFFVSDDRGATFDASCFPAISAGLMGRSVQAFTVASDGSMCVGTASQVFCSDARACTWKEASELGGQWIADFAEDPIDKNVMYLCTGTGQGENGVFVRDAPGSMWRPFGTRLPAWFSRLHVVKTSSSKRFYVSSQETVTRESNDGGPPVEEVRYFVRYSDDDAKTWTSNYYGPTPERANLRLVGIDPTNPDRIVIAMIRTAEQLPDDLYYSEKRGEPGSYVKIGSVTEFSGVTFTPTGEMYYGDNDQMTPGLFRVAKFGEPPTKLIASYKVGCIQYDAASDRLYVCADWKFGTADRASGELTVLFNIMSASKFLACDTGPAMDQQCAPAFRSPNFCDITHYPNAPVCVEYFGTGAQDGGTAGAAGGSDASSAGVGGSSAGSGGSVAVAGRPSDANAGSGPETPAAPSKSPSRSRGCAVAVMDEHLPSWFSLMSSFVVGFAIRRRYSRRCGS